MYPDLPPLPDGETERVPGALLVRGDCDDSTWNDVLSRMGELPGTVTHTPGQALPPAQGPIPRRLLVAQDPARRGVTPMEVARALSGERAWVPDLVLIADRGTTSEADLRPLMAFLPSDDDLYRFRVTPRQAAMTYLVLHRPSIEDTLDHHKDCGAAEVELEPGESYEDWSEGSLDLMGAVLETAARPPLYQPPAAPLPVITQNNWGLLVRTDFSDDRAWAALAADADRHDPRIETLEEYQPYVQIVDDPAFAGATPEQVMAIVRPNDDEDEETGEEVVVIADQASMGGSDRTVLVVPLEDNVGWSFRLPPSEVRSMAANLFVCNNDISDWMNRGSSDGPAVMTERERRSWRGW
ncbi:hypothetical protein [Nocardiopsis sp. MG754419]|uniref:DUF6924 domain-containing protein n=1 Tax=Nocardiopsis sp. MG754419 TaxID=2259865 RepID=UPI001BA6A1EF|nr:hypothetical protein [Nocardiopsis sp. MG754419]MBR8741633.1 hypothetical protein [Nocardiopsis sp. MG754419]